MARYEGVSTFIERSQIANIQRAGHGQVIETPLVPKCALLLATAKMVLDPEAPLDDFAAWLRFYVEEWGDAAATPRKKQLVVRFYANASTRR